MEKLNALQQFNALKAEAKSLGINVSGMKKADIELAISQITTTQTSTDSEIPKLRRGRPVNLNSNRQVKIQARNNGELKRGRPVVEASARQQRIQEKLNKIALGIVIKRGRPALSKA